MIRIAAIALVVLGTFALHAADSKFVIADFEQDADKKYESGESVKIVAEHAKSGTHSLKIAENGNEYPGLGFDDKALMKKFAEFNVFRVDIFNPQDEPVLFTASAGDAKSTNYGTRYNNDGLAAKPGWSTLTINLTGLTRSSSNNANERQKLDSSTLQFFKVFICPGKKVTLYFDDARLENDAGLPKVDGLRAFDFGPSNSPVYTGFEGVNEKTVYAPGGFGWHSPTRHGHPGNPDDLGGDYGTGDYFVADLKTGAGKYVVNICIDTFGEWQSTPHFTHRTMEINDQKVLDESMDGEAFLNKVYFRYEDDEDTPGMDLWERRVKPALPIRQYETEVGADGKLKVSVETQGGWPGLITFMVVYPKAKEAEGKTSMEALEKMRKDAFNNLIPLSLPKPDGPAPKPYKGSVIGFARAIDSDINCNSAPIGDEMTKGVDIAAAPGERTAAQVGLYPLMAFDGVKVAVTDMSGPDGAKIPSTAFTVRKERNFAKRQGGSNSGLLLPMMLQRFDTLTLTPGFTRGLWITANVPADAKAGDYSGSLNIIGPDKQNHCIIHIQTRVYPFTLDKADDITVSCTGTTGGHWNVYQDLHERWWKAADEAMLDQAEHGMNAVTGGPGMTLKGVKDGKPEIDFTDADRWMELAVKHGLTMRGDAYQGFDVNLGFGRSQNKDCMQTNDQNSQKLYGVPFAELIKIVYGAVEAHAKEKHWPPRSYYLLDEPRPEFGNIESALKLTELHAQSAPETKFSGYYSGGDGRDAYFKVMPITIAHHSEASIKACRDAGKEAWTYSGGGARYDIGRWLFFAKRKGLTGFLRNGYEYTNSDPYYDFSDTEGSWAQVYPGKRGLADTIGWERTAEGVNDYRYLKTLQARIDAARKDGKHAAEADAAEKFLQETLKPINLDHEDSGALKPEQWVEFRAELAKHLTALTK